MDPSPPQGRRGKTRAALNGQERARRPHPHARQGVGARQITANSVAPGFVKTDLNRQPWSPPENEAAHASLSVFGRMGQPTDVADIVALLTSDDARWITGRRIAATGGTGL
ncbi:SDR family oxidoreductase [Streptomyces griseiscabiei]|uniref:SDR family oxidoreductase n=1 Tax=Streptomyces griseiscabiei TaxID=2993540 RepID=A0ABU4KZF2_9ACTN|nr:SDR family oxidoreductase [Streptomyces griseiscabiei]MBZ3908792.1 SDR family oxidoreductase [Streptomyces griseiscabiei]MDX2908718.1 SDR family oxidoreductase [Streptomyces griseiscabiei]